MIRLQVLCFVQDVFPVFAEYYCELVSHKRLLVTVIFDVQHFIQIFFTVKPSIVRNGETEKICCSHVTYTIVEPARDTELRSMDFDLRVIWFSERVGTRVWFSTSTFGNWSSARRLIAFQNFAHVGVRFNWQIVSFARYGNTALRARIIIGDVIRKCEPLRKWVSTPLPLDDCVTARWERSRVVCVLFPKTREQ